MENHEILQEVKKLVGRKDVHSLWEGNEQNLSIPGTGHSQFNEILISFGCKVTSSYFFKEFWGETIESIQHLKRGIDKFRQTALLLYGNIAYAYKSMVSMTEEEFSEIIEKVKPIPDREFKNRHDPVYLIKKIDGNETRYNGYFVRDKINKRFTKNPDDANSRELWENLKRIKTTAEYNHNAYLCSDHMDVYVATSMRKAHEFLLVSEFCNKVFSRENILSKDLKLRWFDPTQACCDDRVDKGLSEALMLRRSKCTIYLIQESDTLGKASEMASTLAQGKTVIAFVPSVNEDTQYKWFNWFKDYSENGMFDDYGQQKILRSLAETYCCKQLLKSTKSEKDNSLSNFRDWYFGKMEMPVDDVVWNIVNSAKETWNSRAETLKDKHPLGIQVDLSTGVANGVLVVRDEDKCIELVRRVVLNEMEYDVEDANGYVLLRERLTDCIYRVSSNDAVLVNSFWNYYL